MATDNNAIVKEIFESVKYMVDTSIKEAPYDKTVVGIIVGGSSLPKHYNVKIQDAVYDLPCYISNKMKPNTPVNVMVPQNNMDFAFIYGMLGGEDGSGIGTVTNAERAEYAVTAGYANTVAVATETVVGGLLSSSGKNHVTVSPTGIATVTDVSHADNADNATNAVNAQDSLHANNADRADTAGIADTVTNVPIATETKVGGIKSGTGVGVVNVAPDGTATVEMPDPPDPYELPIATETVLGGIYSSTGPGHVVVNPDGTAVVPDAGGIKEIPVATETEVGGVISSQESGKLNVSPDGVSTINDVVLIDESGKIEKPQEWGLGPWKIICTEDSSLDENNGLPTGGTTNQTLIKNSDTDYDVSWGTQKAENISFDGTASSSSATTVQNALDQAIAVTKENQRSISANKTEINALQDITDAIQTDISTNTSNIAVIKNRLVFYSNDNLLDNWYFINPINQKGQTSYSGSLISIDRWFCRNITLKVNESSCTVISNAAGVSFEQLVSNLDLYRGKTLTLSLLQANNTLNTLTYTIPTTGAFDHGGAKDLVPGNNIYLNFWTTSGIDFFRARIVWQVANIPIEIVAMKLELGTQQTLAHQDSNGNWILNDAPPNYQQELARCQRYLCILKDGYPLYGIIGGNSNPHFFVEIPVPLYKNPTIAFGTGFLMATQNGRIAVPVNQVKFYSMFNNILNIQAPAVASLYTKYTSFNGYIEGTTTVDANI